MNKYTLSYRFLNGNVHGCVFAKKRPVSLNWTDYIMYLTITCAYDYVFEDCFSNFSNKSYVVGTQKEPST